MPAIEQLIKQTKFQNARHKAMISVMYASNMIVDHYESIFKKFHLTLQQYNALRILRGQYPKACTVNLIRERMLDKMSDASRIVERLRRAGYVERVTNKEDRRAVDVLITEKGLDLLKQVDKLESEMNLPANTISEKEALELNEILNKVINGLID
jgi:MarR family multiple gene transcriptional regulator MgrA